MDCQALILNEVKIFTFAGLQKTSSIMKVPTVFPLNAIEHNPLPYINSVHLVSNSCITHLSLVSVVFVYK